MSHAPDDKLHVVSHPLVEHLLTSARDLRTGPAVFRQLVRQLGVLLAYEATRDVAMEPSRIDTPMEPYPGRKLRTPLTIVPILRAGLGMAEGVIDLLPEAHVGHLGMFRDESKLTPVSYYDKLPPDVAGGPVLLVDPMLATGGSAASAAALLRKRHCSDIRMICLVAAPEGVARLHAADPQINIFTAALDRQLNAKGYILPGLGDAGDRLYGTGQVE